MDSLTQFVLGAAVGEACLGKKLGNSAILLGGIFGTIPDLDVLFNPYVTDLQGLQIHRGISHSIFFAIFFGAFSAWLLNVFYSKDRSLLKIRNLNWKINSPNIKYIRWFLFTFLALQTHSILDSFTTYGTQLFAPFSNYRVGFNNIFVADLFYTIPFLICLITCMFFVRTSKKRRMWNWIGISISSLYMLFTISTKVYTNQVFKDAFVKNKINIQRYTTSPTPLNSFLWSVVAETEEAYHLGHYSIFDKDKEIEFTKLKKNSILRDKFNQIDGFEIIKWFSNDYFILTEVDSYTAYVDLRFGPIDYESIDRTSYPFFFKISEKNNYLNVIENIDPPKFEDGEFQKYFRRFVARVAGEK